VPIIVTPAFVTVQVIVLPSGLTTKFICVALGPEPMVLEPVQSRFTVKVTGTLLNEDEVPLTVFVPLTTIPVPSPLYTIKPSVANGPTPAIEPVPDATYVPIMVPFWSEH